jgi:nicotinate-nucleotide--dimethylbenzimidazole phosphoribosyltransferase
MWILKPSQRIDADAVNAAIARQAVLTKPPGSLGDLEGLAIALAGMQGEEIPSVQSPYIAIFAGDHGIADEGVSAFPQVVTGEMVKNFARGGAAISVLAKHHGATLEVFNTGTVGQLPELDGVFDRRVAAGSANFAKQAAMTVEQCEQAMNIGKEAVARAKASGANVFVAGEMGIANTTPATAMACVLLAEAAATLAGPGTGLDGDGVARKAQIIDQAIAKHALNADNAIEVLQTLGGFEIAAIVGAYIAAAQQGVAIVVDGFIASSAALLDAKPLLNMGMRLGEGSGGALALGLLQSACALHGQMATFAEAGVSQ